jgi:vacuolar-type H+-ATPase subunit H
MSDIDAVRKAEQEQAAAVSEEQAQSEQRINRARTDASIRVSNTQKERKGIIEDILEKGRGDAEREVAFIREENASRNEATLKEESGRVDAAVEYILGKIIT